MESGKRREPIAFPVRPNRAAAAAITPEDLRRSLFIGPADIRKALFAPRRVAKTPLFASAPDVGSAASPEPGGAESSVVKSIVLPRSGAEPTASAVDTSTLEDQSAEPPSHHPVEAKRLPLLKRISRYFDL